MTARGPLLNRKVIGIAAKLYEVQEQAKRLYGQRYEEMVEPYRHMLRSLTAAGKFGSELEAAKRLLQTLQARPEETSVSQMLLMAATVDVIELEGDTAP
jgi:hypothetical protein